jgi:YidC/Oxa1 family membrane protein insertase
MTDQKNLILAIVISVAIILAFQFFYEIPRMQAERERIAEMEAAEEVTVDPETGLVTAPAPVRAPTVTLEEALDPVTRVPIDNGRVHGSLSAYGSRIDDLTLADYHLTPDPRSPEIRLLSPRGTDQAFFAEFGWLAGTGTANVPGRDTEWTTFDHGLTFDRPVTMTWANGEGLTFTQTIALDRDYMFTITREVRNSTNSPVELHPYGLVSRLGTPPTMGFFILHEGPIGVFGNPAEGERHRLQEINYSKVQDEGTIEYQGEGGWLGFSDKYWLTALIPGQDAGVRARFQHSAEGDRYQLDFMRDAVTVDPHSTLEITDQFFAGAKEVRLLDHYRDQYGIPLFDRAVDFGWFYFLTKPIFYVLDFFHGLFGNYGVAILILTLIVKIIFYPLADKSYRSMSQMKKLQPEMIKLREKYAEDRQKMNQELMALYKREGVNPVSGCLPIVVQIPVFFALYKVLFVSIEMRHAPFFGWINDLSAPDPVTPVNLFGLLPFDPGFLTVGIWPILMGLTMLAQMRLNPQPADPMQARVMMMLPLVFIFLFAQFPAGLVIYWTWNNLLSVAQQWLIMRRMGVQI